MVTTVASSSVGDDVHYSGSYVGRFSFGHDGRRVALDLCPRELHVDGLREPGAHSQPGVEEFGVGVFKYNQI